MKMTDFSNESFNKPTLLNGFPLYKSGIIELPLVGTVKAGPPTMEDTNINEFVSLDHYLISHPGHSYLLRVKTDSMAKEGIHEGDLVILDKKRTPANGDIVAVQVNEEWILTYYYRENNAVKFIPASEYSANRSEDQNIGGVVVSVIRKYY